MWKSLSLLLLLILAAGFIRTAQLEYTAENDLFLRGQIPSPLPSGIYHGSLTGFQTSWQGKKFDSVGSNGTNLFNDNGKVEERYPFATSVGKAEHDYGFSVLKMDYNISDNPLWLRPLIDEVVETSPGNYIGKLEFRIFPYFPFTLGFFTLSK